MSNKIHISYLLSVSRNAEVVSIGLFLYHFSWFLCNGVRFDVFKLSISDFIVSQKGSKGEEKYHFFGRGYILLSRLYSTVQKGHITKPE